ncbi:MAG: hypothetical protein ABIR47_17290 [Candidatus Kapaibacterium sp.]
MENIRSVMLLRGSPAERPRIQVIAGIAFLGLGAYFLINLLMNLINPERIVGGFGIRAVIVIPFILFMGGWLVYTALRRRYFLLIQSEKDRRKIVFRGDVDTHGLTQFITEVQSIINMEITSRVDAV